MIILDTNVLSALMKVAPEPCVVEWLDKQPRSSIWTSSVTVLEIRFGLQVLPGGKKRTRLLESFDLLLNQIGNRIAQFDKEAALIAGDLMAVRQKRGAPVDLRDTMIAGIVLSQRSSLATRNTSHFKDLTVTLVNPWTD